MARTIPRWKAAQLPPNYFVESFYLRNQPVIITDLANDWPAVSKWTPEYLISNWGDKTVTGLTWEVGTGGTYIEEFLNFTRWTATLKEWGELILNPQGSRRGYLTFSALRVIPELQHDIKPLDQYMNLPRSYPRKLRQLSKKQPSLWFGGAGQVSPMHFDTSQNFLVQINGKKNMMLFPPEEAENLYWPCDDIKPFRFHEVNWTPVNPKHPDLTKYPRLAQAEGIDITLEPGDVLYLPVRWWHYTTGLDVSLSVNFFWQSHWTILRNSDLIWPTFKRLMNKRLYAG